MRVKAVKEHNTLVWQACTSCGKGRWVRLYRDNSGLCASCSGRKYIKKLHGVGAKSSHWMGGRHKDARDGYIQVWLSPDDFFYPMVKKTGYVAEHRLVVAKALNRCLLPWEIVHHKGTKYPSGSMENRSDNRYPENLQLLEDKRYHLIDSLVKTRIKRLEDRIKHLENRVTLLESENLLLKEGVKYAEV